MKGMDKTIAFAIAIVATLLIMLILIVGSTDSKGTADGRIKEIEQLGDGWSIMQDTETGAKYLKYVDGYRMGLTEYIEN